MPFLTQGMVWVLATPVAASRTTTFAVGPNSWMCGMICWLRLTRRDAAMRSVLRSFAEIAYFLNDQIQLLDRRAVDRHQLVADAERKLRPAGASG